MLGIGTDRTWIIVVHNIGVIRAAKIPTAPIVNISVPVVVNAVGALVATDAVRSVLTGIAPDVSGEIRVIYFNTGIHDADDNRGITLCDVPCLRSLNLCKAVLTSIRRIVWHK